MITIWGRPNSVNVQKVMWAVGELDLAHERIDAGGQFGRLDTDDYGKINPNRTVPALIDGETVMWESNACVRYLAAKHGRGGLWLDQPERRAMADMWMDWQATVLNPVLGIVFWGLIRTPPEKRDMDRINQAQENLKSLWARLDGWLADRPYVVGNALTMGDIPAGASFYRYCELPIERPSLPHCERWYDALKNRRPFQEHVMIPLT